VKPDLPPDDPALAHELLAMDRRDQDARREAVRHPDDPAALQAVRDIDTQNGRRLSEILDTHGWPGNRLVGKPAASAAWLLAQHQDNDSALQQRCLDLLKDAVSRDDASGTDLAYLTDRVRTHQGQPQIYGTQLHGDAGGQQVPFPVADPDHLDERRAALGLDPEARYVERVNLTFGPDPDPLKPAGK
jgi:hypothetical protein